jgi:23S rRNA pseudouridine2605 synthase
MAARPRSGAARGPIADRRRPGTVSLERALSKLGMASRSDARALIDAGRVTVDGRAVRDPGRAVVPERVRIAIDGEGRTRAALRTVLLHKPRGVVTTRRDPEGRPTAYDLVRDAGPQLQAIGRLDYASSGLLLFTTDTRLAAALTDPDHAVPRVYVVTVRGAVDDAALEALGRGTTMDGVSVAPRAVTMRKRSGRETHLIVELVEGRNREIRRLFAAVGHEVTRLLRVSFGGVELGTLAPGRWRTVTDDEIARLRRWNRAPQRGQPLGRPQPRRLGAGR